MLSRKRPTRATLFGGQELSGWERGLGLIPGVSELAGTVRAVNKVDNIVEVGIQANQAAGKAAENFLANTYGGAQQVSKSTSLGTRYIDNLVDGVAMESKVGRTSLTSRIETQINKD